MRILDLMALSMYFAHTILTPPKPNRYTLFNTAEHQQQDNNKELCRNLRMSF